MNRRVIFVDPDYWNQKENNSMSDKPNARDVRLSAALTIHHRSADRDGMADIALEASEAGRANQLVMALMNLHRVYIMNTRTVQGINFLGTWVQDMGNVKPIDDAALDIHRACRILDAHGHDDYDTINQALRSAIGENRVTQTILAILDLYQMALPELSSTAGKEFFDACVSVFVEQEGGLG